MPETFCSSIRLEGKTATPQLCVDKLGIEATPLAAKSDTLITGLAKRPPSIDSFAREYFCYDRSNSLNLTIPFSINTFNLMRILNFSTQWY